MVCFHTANTVFFNIKKITMLACLHECRGKNSCTHWPYLSILQGLITYRVSFLQVLSSHLRKVFSYSFYE